MLAARLYPLTIATLLVAAAGCNDAIKNTLDNRFVNYLTKEDKYTALPMPSTLQTGGSLVYVKTEGNKKTIEWVGDLLACNVPETVVFGESQEIRNKTKNASFPSFTASSKNDFGLAATLRIKGVGVNADLGTLRKTVITVDTAGHETIQRLAVANYLADPLKRAQMKDYCVDAIETQKVAVLVDVAYVEKGAFEFYRDEGLTLKLSPPEVIKALDLNASAKAKVKEDGTMTINERIYVAFKESFYVPESGTLAVSAKGLEDATADLKAALGGP